jgi:iron-sulfur cluster assembly protein
VRIVVDPKSAPHLADLILDYADGLNESGFRIENPHAATTCGCGGSFSV